MSAMQQIVEQVAAAVLYEGYILYPYRPSLKNSQRWTFGGVVPRAYSQAHRGENCRLDVECLLEAPDDASLSVRVRFLHLVNRTVCELTPALEHWPMAGEPAYRRVQSLCLGSRRYDSWQEAEEREVQHALMRLPALAQSPRAERFCFPSGREIEPLEDAASGRITAALLRERHQLDGVVEIGARRLDAGLWKIHVSIINDSMLDDAEQIARDQAMAHAFASTHTILTVEGGEFISLIDPPDRLREAAAGCRNQGAWPVLVGEPNQADTMLAAPIILYDYPRVAPESPGDLFDGTEIDEILSLRVLTLTDQEHEQMAAIEQNARALLHRTQSLTPAALAGLHGTLRAHLPE